MHNDASIKSKDVQTDKSGEYSTTDNISVLSVISLYGGFLGLTNMLCIFYSIHYNKSSNTTSIACYYTSSYVDHKSLDEYINNKNDDTMIYVYSNKIDYSISIRLYYI